MIKQRSSGQWAYCSELNCLLPDPAYLDFGPLFPALPKADQHHPLFLLQVLAKPCCDRLSGAGGSAHNTVGACAAVLDFSVVP
jgi:hypothetical protein